MIEKIRYRLVHNRKNRLNKQGMALVQVEAHLAGRKAYYSTKVYLRPSEWNKGKAMVTERANATELNAFLYDCILKMENIELSAWKRGAQCTFAMLRDGMKRKRPTNVDFLTFAEQAIEDSTRKDSTKENMRTTVKALREYKSGMDFGDVTHAMVLDFEKRMKEAGLAVNTVGKHMRQLRTLVNEAIAQGYMSQDDYPFRKIRIRKERGRNTYLTQRELGRLERLDVGDEKSKRVRDAFLFCCYTGLRYSDFVRLGSNDIVRKKGHEWLCVRMRKTDTIVSVPLHLVFGGKALELINRNGGVEGMTGIGNNSEANRGIREVASLAGIRKRISWHTSRHTCATLLVYGGTSITTVQKILGHSSLKTTQVYAEITDDTVERDLRRSGRHRVESMESTHFLPNLSYT